MKQWLVYFQGQYTDWACVWKTKLNNPKWMPFHPWLQSQSQTASQGSRRLRTEDEQTKGSGALEIPSQKTHLGGTWNPLLPPCGSVTSSATGWDHSGEKNSTCFLFLFIHWCTHILKARGRQITTTRFCTVHGEKKKHTKEQIFTLIFNDERKDSKEYFMIRNHFTIWHDCTIWNDFTIWNSNFKEEKKFFKK